MDQADAQFSFVLQQVIAVVNLQVYAIDSHPYLEHALVAHLHCDLFCFSVLHTNLNGENVPFRA